MHICSCYSHQLAKTKPSILPTSLRIKLNFLVETTYLGPGFWPLLPLLWESNYLELPLSLQPHLLSCPFTSAGAVHALISQVIPPPQDSYSRFGLDITLSRHFCWPLSLPTNPSSDNPPVGFIKIKFCGLTDTENRLVVAGEEEG